MKKFLLNTCVFSLLLIQTVVPCVAADNTATSAAGTAAKSAIESRNNNPGQSKASAEGKEYKPGAGNKAATADMTLDVASAAWPLVYAMLRDLIKWEGIGSIKQWLKQTFWTTSLPPATPPAWFPIGRSGFDPVGAGFTIAHAAVNEKWKDATKITASFVGEEGHVTDKWAGPPNRNTVTRIMGDFEVSSQKFGALAFDPSEYDGLDNAQSASARELMEYRENELIEDQRSLKNVTDENWGLLYRAQQRSIKALAGAMSLKQQLKVLAEVDGKVSGEYGSQPQALNSLAARRVLNDALLLLKMNVVAARAKMRASALELEFKPLTRDIDNSDEETPDNPPMTYTGSNG